ncbi:hypothetical protein FRC00_008572 [Tulasnella sp. 408]|nr:hypothetical protein FRC00_008572 [Tulasnella sp. 408]
MAELQHKGIPGRGLDFIYVDEAQDHLMVDVALLRTLCRNPHGLFFAGDTAQTISLGSTFRFSELKAFLYRLERGDPGIVNAAAFLVHLISSYFGYSIDSLAPEVPPVDVCLQRPIFMLGQESRSDFLKLVSGGADGKVRLEADQGKQMRVPRFQCMHSLFWSAIIVRDDTAARTLQEVIGDIPGLLTIYQSKGLEWNDVILYDFFADSPATSTDWRAILHSQRSGKWLDEQKHSILRRELKSLYVGLTRARMRVWIWDRSTNGADFQASTPYNVGDPIPHSVGAHSSKEDWSQRGQQYFSKGLYSKAGICFKNAGMQWWEHVCQAYGNRQAASTVSPGYQRRVELFSKAASAFQNLASISQGSVSPATKRRLFINAGECYAATASHATAACAFIDGQKFTEAAYQYRLSGQFEEAIRVINQHPVDTAVKDNIIYEAKLAYSMRGDLSSLLKARELFGSNNEFLEFLKTRELDEQRVTFLDYLKEYEQAGDILWDRGKYVPAFDRFRLAKSASSRHKVAACMLDGLRTEISFANGYGKQSKVLSELLQRSNDAGLSPDEEHEIELLRDVANCEPKRLKERRRLYQQSKNKLYELVAFDALISSDVRPSLESASEVRFTEVLKMCQMFQLLVKTIVGTHGIVDEPAAQNLFGVSVTQSSGTQEETISVKYPSFAYTALPPSALTLVNATKGLFSVAVSKRNLADYIRKALLARSNQVISDVDFLARKSRAFELCQSSHAGRQCDEPTQPCGNNHLPDVDSTSSICTFNSQFKLHIMMISLLNRYSGLGKDGKRTRAEKLLIWFTRLFKLCYPSTNKSGNLLDIEPSLIPEYQQVENRKNFLDNVVTTGLLATAFDYIAAASYLSCGEWDPFEIAIAREYGLLHPESGRSLAEAALTWCTQKTTDSLKKAVDFLTNALGGDVWLDIEVAVTLVEEVCGQLIFNLKMHRANDSRGLMMPRSWILRALRKGPSLLPSDNTLRILVASLAKFVDILSLKGYNVGLNIPALRCPILASFNEIDTGPFLPTVSEDESASRNRKPLVWDSILRALRLVSSNLDELLVVTRKEGGVAESPGSKKQGCLEQRPSTDQFSIPSHNALAPLPRTTDVQDQLASHPGRPAPVIEISLDPGEFQDQAPHAINGEASNGSQRSDKSATTIRSFFHLHQSFAPTVTAFEGAIKLQAQMSESCADNRFLVFYLQGLLLHVAAYLARVQTSACAEFERLKEIAGGRHRDVDDSKLPPKALRLREITKYAKELLIELLPMSDFYFDGTSNSPESLSGVLKRIKKIPGLIESLRPFATLPNNTLPNDFDYDVEVKPLLKYLAPWARKEVITAG